MSHDFRMPDLGEGLTEADIVSWAVDVGDRVELNQVIAEVESAKALVELPSPYAGEVEALLVKAATTVPVGTPIIRIRTDDDALADRGDPEKNEQVLVGYGPGAEPRSKRRRAADAAADREQPASARIHATPAARRAARERGIDLASVTGTGPDRAVTVSDLDSHTAPDSPSDTRTPVVGVRKQMATAMTKSAFTAPQATVFLTVDVTRSVDLIAHLRADPHFAGLTLTPLTLVAKATVTAVRHHPQINAAWDERTGEVVVGRPVNLGIAAATERGLVVPNVKNADAMTLIELCRAIGELTSTARAGRATPSDLSGGTLSITNVGSFGVDTGTPILNPGESAILCLGRIAKRPWIRDAKVTVRDVTTLSLTFDHRVLDGEQTSRFLTDVGDMLTDPTILIAHL